MTPAYQNNYMDPHAQSFSLTGTLPKWTIFFRKDFKVNAVISKIFGVIDCESEVRFSKFQVVVSISRSPYRSRFFEFWVSDFRFVISDPKNFWARLSRPIWVILEHFFLRIRKVENYYTNFLFLLNFNPIFHNNMCKIWLRNSFYLKVPVSSFSLRGRRPPWVISFRSWKRKCSHEYIRD